MDNPPTPNLAFHVHPYMSLAGKVYQSYELCCGDGSGMGDGITPLTSAFGMAGAQRYVELEVRGVNIGQPYRHT